MVGELIVDVISFQKIYGLCCLKGYIVEMRRGVTLVDGRRTTDNGQRKTECEDRARILETGFFVDTSVRIFFCWLCSGLLCVAGKGRFQMKKGP